ncbi:hypothetical protein C4K03_1797 [Pseudomonas synxantha]|uniref:Uncharacterized protein n=1 Tax=Pseudomonas synxantha TaxID=47883 RepID=A0A3G7U602_9PSED|nr:hypothetical protein [Pseudomonas synxantha]AZE53966.1 hypothetical protein C4K03_1797 [Pseudomonas synxantha]
MRYMKLAAQRFYDDDTPDVVKLEWHDSQRARSLVRCITVFDMNNDGKLDCAQSGDVDNDGVSDEWDRFKAITLARQFLDFNWYSRDQSSTKFLKVSAYAAHAGASADSLHLAFHIGEAHVAFEAHFYSVPDGPQGAFNPDVNGDGQVDFVDADLIRMFCTGYQALGWFNARLPATLQT